MTRHPAPADCSADSESGRYGYRQGTGLLRNEGWRVNHKQVERI